MTQTCKICGEPIKLDELSEKMLEFFGDVGGAHGECLETINTEEK